MKKYPLIIFLTGVAVFLIYTFLPQSIFLPKETGTGPWNEYLFKDPLGRTIKNEIFVNFFFPFEEMTDTNYASIDGYIKRTDIYAKEVALSTGAIIVGGQSKYGGYQFVYKNKSPEELDALIKKIKKLPGVDRVATYLIIAKTL